MPALRQYNGGAPVPSLQPTDGVWLDRIGMGTVWIEAQNLPGGGGIQEFLVTASGIVLQVKAFYGVKTGATAISLTLPPRALQSVPSYLDIMDLDNNAGVNNITINAFSGDMIYDHGIWSSSFVMQISNTMSRLAVNTNGWTAISYGS